MDDQKKSVIITIVVALVILAILFGTIFYLIKLFQGRSATNNAPLFPAASNIPSTSSLPVSSETPAPTGLSTSNSSPFLPGTYKVYNGAGFSLQFPKTWGILTCKNSQNFEFDPYSPQDQLGVVCGNAVKPMTVIVGNATCQGQTVTLGNTQVVKSQRTGSKGKIYEWCTKTTPMLDITHRVAPQTQPGYSADDFSAEVEKVISSMRFAQGS